MRIHPTILLVIALMSGGAFANFSSDDQSSIVSGMNTLRTRVSPASQVPIQNLVWNNDLASNALGLATLCGSQYMSDAGASGVYSESVQTFDSDPNGEMLINAFSIGKEGYNYDDNLCYDNVDCAAYTNMLWEQSSQVGCAKVDCGSNTSGGSLRWRVVCNWNPAGSFAGVKPYTAVSHTSASLLNTDPNYSTYTEFDSNSGVNRILDLTNQDDAAKAAKSVSKKTKAVSSTDFDYRQNGIVPVPVDSRDCSAAYAFVAAAIAQTRVAMKRNVRPTVSVQQIIDCMNNNTATIGGVRSGCVNGSIHDALIYIRDFGLMKESDYPYTGASSNGVCKYDANKLIVKGGYMEFSDTGKQNILSKARNDGPVGVAVYADINLYDYRSGVYYCDNSFAANTTNHAVLLVGYNKDHDYYIVRNDWGTQWGENGFARITADPNHDCGISNNLAASMNTN
ncbi:hypothetical protein DFA_01006 [Cavenderia fasciculata]|uniref:Gamete and mating-type specific protein A n=1 Tax=Cavenderia fasciculata TaxID=261658 RepID=F4PV15_CACFS|nr:uncharacterized protein DFA_01006 [Cavenderia fasciculata]EGG21131.1 hypothetical protein DFA_01006 [Cavenderia fasciculata]|eukprot:XP_004358981.1 hypothetical protein DFA_01006 [Cavenderia fasciculata]